MSDIFDTNDTKEEDTQSGRFLTFNLGEEVYGFEIKYITEIIGLQAITEVPEVPDYVKGIINLRGKIIPVIDIRLKFKKEHLEYNDRTCIIVIDLNELSVGMIVDNVDEVMTIDEEDITPPPVSRMNVDNKYIKGIGKKDGRIQLLLDCATLLKAVEVEL